MISFLCVLAIVIAVANARVYKKYSGYDVFGYDIKQMKGATMDELRQECDRLPECVGYNKGGWLKYEPGVAFLPGNDLYLDEIYEFPDGTVPRFKVWPLPAEYTFSDKVVCMNPKVKINTSSKNEMILEAIKRFRSETLDRPVAEEAGCISRIDIVVVDDSVPFETNHNEEYTLEVPSTGEAVSLKGATPLGVLHGLTSLSLLVRYNFDLGKYVVDSAPVSIVDRPKYWYRGVQMDTSRHFIPVSSIVRVLNAMSMLKLNQFHWHVSDDQSMPLFFYEQPSLSKAAYSPYEVYYPGDVQKVIDHGKMLGIHVIIQLNLPNHMESWCTAIPSLCVSSKCRLLDPSQIQTEQILKSAVKEWTQASAQHVTFPGEYVHIGGENVDLSCWNEDSKVSKWMSSMGLTADKAYERLLKIIDDYLNENSRHSILAEDAFERFPGSLRKTSAIQVRKNNGTQLLNVLNKGFQAIFSPSPAWDLSEIKVHWRHALKIDTDVTGEFAKNYLGGEVTMDTHLIDASVLDQRLFPRTIAAAGKLWSSDTYDDFHEASKRISLMRCTMGFRGIGAAPVYHNAGMSPVGPAGCLLQ